MGITAKKQEKRTLLSHEETLDLIDKVQRTGDEQAKEILIENNLGLVRSVVSKFLNIGYDRDDLFQLGSIGLIKAIYKFDPRFNVKFSTYAVPMILGEIKRYLRDNNSIRVSRSMRDTAYKAIYTKEKLTKLRQKEPTINEIASEIGVPKEDIVLALEAVQTPVSLYEPVYNDGGDTLYVLDQVSDKKDCEENWVSRISLKEAVEKLSPREKKIITMRFFECKTQMETAAEIGISQAQVSRLEKMALKSMRNFLG